jgi:hypothetical protein
MGQGQGVSKCDGCNKSTPFFGEIYGRMSEDFHGRIRSGMSHGLSSLKGSELREFEEFNWFKDQLLIPFWGTALAIRVLYAAVAKDLEQWEASGLSIGFIFLVDRDDEVFYLFGARVVIALVPVVGTVINGLLDIIAYFGIWYKQSGTASLERKIEQLPV